MSTFCKSNWCWRHAHEVCQGDWLSETGIFFRCTCECHGAHRLTPVLAGADLEMDATKDEGDGGMGSGKWLEPGRDYDPAYPEEEEDA